MSLGNKMLDNTVLSGLLGAEGMAELKSKMIDMIVEEVREQLQQSSTYIIAPDDIGEELYRDIIKEVKEDFREEYKQRIIAKLDALI